MDVAKHTGAEGNYSKSNLGRGIVITNYFLLNGDGSVSISLASSAVRGCGGDTKTPEGGRW